MNTCFIGAVSVQLAGETLLSLLSVQLAGETYSLLPVGQFRCLSSCRILQLHRFFNCGKIFQFHIVGECIEVTLTPKFEENFAVFALMVSGSTFRSVAVLHRQ